MDDPCSSPDLITLEQALDYILSACPPNLFYERLAIRNTRQRLTFEPVYAATNVPSFRNSAMDGYALQHSDQQQTSLKLVGCSWAGRPYTGPVAKGECVRIFTGAYVPEDCDCVVMQENVTANSDSITINSWPTPFENVRDIGSDIQQGNIIVDKGQLIKPADIGLLASCGVADIAVYKKLTVGFFSTGDELISIGQQPLLGDIFDSNRYTLHALLDEAGVTALDLGVIPDNFSAVEEALLSASQLCDVIITTGGVSVGDADFITDVLKKIGRVELWKIAIKPGKPLAFGHIKESTFFGLPGNPVSVMVTFQQVVLPALQKMMGQQQLSNTLTLPAITTDTINKQPGRMEFQRGIVKNTQQGLSVTPISHQGSHLLSSMSKANCFILLDQQSGPIEKGQTVNIQPFN